LWRLLRNRGVAHHKFRRQHPVGPYFVDLICLESKLVIEVDGGQHVEQTAYDEQRTQYLEGLGFRVIRFWNHDVLTRTDSVMQVIFDALGGRPSP
jgi:very-short-patch-repair endonuclease